MILFLQSKLYNEGYKDVKVYNEKTKTWTRIARTTFNDNLYNFNNKLLKINQTYSVLEKVLMQK